MEQLQIEIIQHYEIEKLTTRIGHLVDWKVERVGWVQQFTDTLHVLLLAILQ